MTKIIPMQQHFEKPLDLVFGNKDYEILLSELELFNEMITLSGIDGKVMQFFVDRAEEYRGKELNHKQIVKAQSEGAFALRASLLKKHLGLSLRKFAASLAATPIYQWFCGINTWCGGQIPSSSKINKLENAMDEGLMKEMLLSFNKNILFDKSSCIKIGFEKEFSCSEIYMDSSCIKSNIHYPVDWLLFRDLIRTSMYKIIMIRDGGIKVRMPETPESYSSRVNTLCIEMHGAFNITGAQKKRKAVFRKMKRHLKEAMGHVKRHLDKFTAEWENHSFTAGRALQIINTLKSMLLKKDQVVSIAHKRIISEKPVNHKKKVYSIYEEDVHMLVRKKDNAKQEFGNTMQLVEQEDGFVIAYELLEDYTKGDAKLGLQSLDYIEEHYSLCGIKSICGDRGYDSPLLRNHLEEKNTLDDVDIKYSVVPRSVSDLKDQMDDPEFCRRLKRRAQTEAKIAHIQGIAGKPMRQKGIRNKKLHLGLSILLNNFKRTAKLLRSLEQKKELLAG
jgi:hypothetical protein